MGGKPVALIDFRRSGRFALSKCYPLPDRSLDRRPLGRFRRRIYEHDEVSDDRIEIIADFMAMNALDDVILEGGCEKIAAKTMSEDDQSVPVAAALRVRLFGQTKCGLDGT